MRKRALQRLLRYTTSADVEHTKTLTGFTHPDVRSTSLSHADVESTSLALARLHVSHPSPINQLPSELLVDIFFIWRSFTSVSEELLVAEKTWIAALRVSRYWRDTALSTSSLWCRIHVDACTSHVMRKTKIMLLRSHHAELTVYIAFNADRVVEHKDELLSMIFEHSWRFRKLTIIGADKSILRLLRSRLTLPAPLLRALVIQPPTRLQPLSDDLPEFPDSLFGGTAQSLRLIYVHSGFSWDSLISVSALTTLRVAGQLPGSLMETLAVLCHVPRLESLTLIDPTKSLWDEAMEYDVRVLELLDLVYLHLQVDMGPCVALLEKMSLPNIEYLGLHLRRARKDLAKRLGPLARKVFPKVPTPDQSSVAYVLRVLPKVYGGGFQCEMWSAHSNSPPCMLNLEMDDQIDIIVVLFDALPVAQIAAVDIDAISTNFLFFDSIFPRTTGVRTLRVGRYSAETVLQWIGVSARGAVSLPQLTRLTLVFTANAWHYDVMLHLATILRARARAGFSLAEIHFVMTPAERTEAISLFDPLRGVGVLLVEGKEVVLRWKGQDRSANAMLAAL